MVDPEIKDCIDYNQHTGIFTWKMRVAGKSPGDEAGFMTKQYRSVHFRGQYFAAHRLAFWFMTGSLPVGTVDHINGNPTDNRFSNLREVTLSENSQNRKRGKNVSGVMGVVWNKTRQKWQAQIGLNRKNIYLGIFETIDEAAVVYAAAKLKMHIGGPMRAVDDRHRNAAMGLHGVPEGMANISYYQGVPS